MDDKKTTTVRIPVPTSEQAALLRILTPEQKLQAMLDVAQKRAAELSVKGGKEGK